MPKIKSVRINLKEHPLSDLFITDIPASARLVVLLGPNGCGKTLLLNAFRHLVPAFRRGPTHYVDVECYGLTDFAMSLNLYMRSAYRTEHTLRLSAPEMIVPYPPNPGSPPRSVPELRGPDCRMTLNFQKLLHQAYRAMAKDNKDWTQAVKDLFSPINERMKRLFLDLEISDIPYPEGPFRGVPDETLCFQRLGARYPYESLSSGEKEVFDLLFDLEMWAREYPDALYCIDEPELHLHPELQASLTEELLEFLPIDSQLWIATHSIGIFRKAMERHRVNSEEIVFLEFSDVPSGAKELRPSLVDRSFWRRALAVTLHDMVGLVSPEEIVICEGRTLGTPQPQKAEFDARVYRKIFGATRPYTEFLCSGSCNDIVLDSIKLAESLRAATPGVKLIRVIDRDDRSPDEIAQLTNQGFRVLSRRSIENYLWSDEILVRLCHQINCVAQIPTVLAKKAELLQLGPNVPEGPLAEVKEISGPLFAELRKIVQLHGKGSNRESFASDTLAKFVVPDTEAYKALDKDIFG